MGLDLSLEHQVALMPPEEQQQVLGGVDLDQLAFDWNWNGRPSQLIPLAGPEVDNIALIVALAGRGFGKCVSLDTVIPHALPVSGISGWTKMGDLVVGDSVFDEQGRPCRVTATFDRFPDKAYRVTFSDGTYIDACDEHQWVTWTHRERKQYLRNNPGTIDFPENWPAHREPVYQALSTGGRRLSGKSIGPEIRTTQQIADTLNQQTARADLNHCIPLAGPLQTQQVPLLLDPWLLGYWLGNGHRRTGHITGHIKDKTEFLERLTCAGYVPGTFRVCEGDKFEVTVLRLVGTLRHLDTLGHKTVPDQYLWASEDQRRALLAGLMDSDGHCQAANGHVEFTSMDRHLADTVVHLARSLSEKPVLRFGRAMLNGKDYGEKYRVTWRPTRNPFTFTRKAAAVRPPGAQALRNRHRMIVSVDPIPPVPMRCITVDSPNSMYLAGEGMIPTHNTLMGAQWIRSLDQHWHSLSRDAAHMRFFLLGRTSADVRDVMLEGPSGLLNIYPPSLRDHVHWTPSRRRIELPGGAVGIAFSAEEPDQLRGPASHVSWVDELAAFKQVRSLDGEATAWQNLRIATRLGNRPQILATTTPKRVPVVKEIMTEVRNKPGQVLLRRGRTTDNKYLSEAYLDVLLSLYGGTALGRQELDGEILDDVVGAMTSEAVIDRNRISKIPTNIPWLRIVSVDPSVAERPHDECGITIIYISATYPVLKRHAVVVDDLSLRAAPEVWGKVVVEAAIKHDAVVVAEVNQGANLVTQMLRLSAMELGVTAPQVRPVWSSKAKAVRSEPVGGAYSQNRVHHLNVMAELEDQLVSWVPGESGYSPDRMDAVVHGLAAGMFPEALISGIPGSAAIHSVANQRVPMRSTIDLAAREMMA